MNIRTMVLISILSAWAASAWVEQAKAEAWYTPLAWQQLVTFGPLQGQKKNITWIRDQNRNFVDDVLDSLATRTARANVIVDLNQGVPSDSIVMLFSPFGRIRYIGRVATVVVLDSVQTQGVDSIAASPLVAMVEIQPPISPAVAYSTRAIQARANTVAPVYSTSAESKGKTGAGVRIAILDTGVMQRHQAIPAQVAGFDAVAFEDIKGGGPTGNTPNQIDDTCEGSPIGDGDCTDLEDEPGDGSTDPCRSGPCSSHGTHIVGVALGRGIMAAPDASPPSYRCAGVTTPDDEKGLSRNCVGTAADAGLVDIRVCENDSQCALQDVLEGLDWLAFNAYSLQIKVANLSWVVCADDDPTGALNVLVDAIAQSGVVMVAAHGNQSRCAVTVPCDSSDPLRRSDPPGSATYALTVSAVNDRNTILRKDDSAYSNGLHGPTCGTSFQLKPDVSAPGEGVWAPVPDASVGYYYEPTSGTSIAAAHASGVAAILLGANPTLTPLQVTTKLRATADRPTASTPYNASLNAYWSKEFGMGIINIDGALQTGDTDVAFPSCASDPGVAGRPCGLSSPKQFWENDIDIRTDTSPLAGVPNKIIAAVKNRGPDKADVDVRFGVYAVNAGATAYYDVGQTTVSVDAGQTVDAIVNWTPTEENHQCILVSLQYGLDTRYWNNLTQRNIIVGPAGPLGGEVGTDRYIVVENPFRRAASFRAVAVPAKGRWSPKGIAVITPAEFEYDPAKDAPPMVHVRLTMRGAEKDAQCKVAIYGVPKGSPADSMLIGGVTMRTFIPKSCTIRGTVYDERNHAIAGVKVRYGRASSPDMTTWESTATKITTAANGSFEAKVEEKVPYRFRYARDGEAVREKILTPECGKSIRLTYGAP
jgi:subtilase family protein